MDPYFNFSGQHSSSLSGYSIDPIDRIMAEEMYKLIGPYGEQPNKIVFNPFTKKQQEKMKRRIFKETQEAAREEVQRKKIKEKKEQKFKPVVKRELQGIKDYLQLESLRKYLQEPKIKTPEERQKAIKKIRDLEGRLIYPSVTSQQNINFQQEKAQDNYEKSVDKASTKSTLGEIIDDIEAPLEKAFGPVIQAEQIQARDYPNYPISHIYKADPGFFQWIGDDDDGDDGDDDDDDDHADIDILLDQLKPSKKKPTYKIEHRQPTYKIEYRQPDPDDYSDYTNLYRADPIDDPNLNKKVEKLREEFNKTYDIGKIFDEETEEGKLETLPQIFDRIYDTSEDLIKDLMEQDVKLNAHEEFLEELDRERATTDYTPKYEYLYLPQPRLTVEDNLRLNDIMLGKEGKREELLRQTESLTKNIDDMEERTNQMLERKHMRKEDKQGLGRKRRKRINKK